MYSFIKWILSMKPVFLIFTCKDKNILYVNEQNKTKQTNPMKLYWNNSNLKVKWRNPRKGEAKSN